MLPHLNLGYAYLLCVTDKLERERDLVVDVVPGEQKEPAIMSTCSS